MNQQLRAFGVPWSPNGFVAGLPPRGGFWKQSKWPRNMVHSMPRRNPCRLYIHLAFTYILRWSLKSSVTLRTWTGSAVSTNESAWSGNGHGSSVSCVKWPWVWVCVYVRKWKWSWLGVQGAAVCCSCLPASEVSPELLERREETYKST